MKKLKIPENLTSLAYRTIKEHVLSSAEPDLRLTEESLAGRLGISKSPIREALNRLETEGLIQIEPRRGAYLRKFTAKEVRDLFDLREALECHAVRRARVTPELIRVLRQTARRMRQYLEAANRARSMDEDAAFHAAIAESTTNGQLVEVLSKLQNQILVAWRAAYDLSSSQAPAAHEAIIDALESGDVDGAVRRMAEHLRFVRDRLAEHLRRGEPASGGAASA